MYSFIVFPYRDAYFWNKYGCIVRDLHIIHALDSCEYVSDILVINRPVSVYERFLGKSKNKSSVLGLKKTNFYDVTDFDLIGPLKKRRWLKDCYSKYSDEITDFFLQYRKSDNVVILDFTPLSILTFDSLPSGLYWYDLIDNFVKHNRYSSYESLLVKNKYGSLGSRELVTCVSEGASDYLRDELGVDSIVINNGLLSFEDKDIGVHNESFLFGFIGFLTSKFDFDYLEKMMSFFPGSKIAVYGDYYDKEIIRKIKSIDYIEYFGGFIESDLDDIMKNFKVGVIPYNVNLSHDESPLKLYQYMLYGKPIFSSIHYEVDFDFIYYGCEFDLDKINVWERYLLLSDKERFECIVSKVDRAVLWESKVHKILDLLKGFS